MLSQRQGRDPTLACTTDETTDETSLDLRPLNAEPSQMTPELAERMARLGITEADLEESFIRGTGAGGQKINKTSSTVVLRYRPGGIEVRCQQERSQAMNRQRARAELCDRIEEQSASRALAAQSALEKTRRQKRKRPKGLKERILQHKHRRAETKKTRGRVRRWD